MTSAAVVSSNYQKILDITHGAQFVKVDLHVHTPASGDAQAKHKYNFEFDTKDIPKSRELVRKIAKQIVDRCLSQNIRLIAITDHNSPSNTHPENLTDTWYQLINEAAKAKGANLCVLPGVEISTNDLHILVIFDPKEDEPTAYTTHRINFLLKDCGFKIIDYGNFKATGTSSLFDVLEYIEEMGTDCIAIPAHIDGGRKAMFSVYKKPSNVFKKLLNHPNLNAVEVVKPTTPSKKRIGKESVEKYFDRVRDDERYPIAFIQDSDGHSINEIGKRFTYVRMGEPSFWSLKNALEDPETRIRMERDYEPDTEKTRIIGIAFRKGAKKWACIGFNQNLNCIIGKKRTKKSTIIDLILYGLDRFKDDEKEDEKKLINEKYSVLVFIRKGSEVICFCREKDGKSPNHYKLENDAFVPFFDKISLELPRKYNHKILEESFSKKTSLMNEILDRHIFTNKKIKSYIENRNKYLKKVKTKDYKHCESDFNKILKNCQSLFDERIKHVKTSFEKYGKKSRKNIFKVKIKEGAWKSITYNDLPTLNKKCFDDYFIDCPSMYVLVKVLVKSRYKHLYKHLDDLSTGDKNAAIMVLIMNQEGFGPLIMDEPEKYLDVNSITGILVPRMRKLKTQQQIICVTNNEYILLSGDAEQVITTKSENKIDVITGDINNSEIQEQILEIFEGDKFELKKKSRKLSNIIE